MNTKIKLEALRLTQEYYCEQILDNMKNKSKGKEITDLLYILLNITEQIKDLKGGKK